MKLRSLIILALTSTFILSAESHAQTVLKFASPAPAPAPVNRVIFEAWANKVSQESEGTIKIDFFPGAQLGQHGQMLDHVKNGVVDIAFEVQGYYPGKFRKSEVINLPFLFRNSEEGTVSYNRLLKTGLLADEYQDLMVINLFTFPNAAIMSKDPIEKLEDMNGQKLAAINPTRQLMFSKLGAIPVSAKIQDWYQSLNRGVLTGVMESLSATRPFRLNEVTKHVLEAPLGGNFAMVVMSKKKFDGLPKPAQKAILDNSGEAFARQHGKFWDGANEDGRKLLTESHATFRKLPDGELAKWVKAMSPITEDWVKATPNGQAVLEAFRKIVADVEAGK